MAKASTAVATAGPAAVPAVTNEAANARVASDKQHRSHISVRDGEDDNSGSEGEDEDDQASPDPGSPQPLAHFQNQPLLQPSPPTSPHHVPRGGSSRGGPGDDPDSDQTHQRESEEECGSPPGPSTSAPSGPPSLPDHSAAAPDAAEVESRTCVSGRVRWSVSSPLSSRRRKLAPPAPISTIMPKKYTWFHFPPEIRVMIYKLCLAWPSSAALYSGFEAQIDAYYSRRREAARNKAEEEWEPFPVYNGRFSTPSVLLLCRAITGECLPILHSQPLIIDRLPPFVPPPSQPPRLRNLGQNAGPGGDTTLPPIAPPRPRRLHLTQFISPVTLQNAPRIDLRLSLGEGRFGSGWTWLPLIDEVFAVLMQRNVFVTLRLLVRVCNVEQTAIWDEEFRVYRSLLNKITIMRALNPNWWRPGDVTIEHWQILRDRAFRLHLEQPYPAAPVQETGGLIKLIRFPYDDIRRYPDREFWPGSVLEFL